MGRHTAPWHLILVLAGGLGLTGCGSPGTPGTATTARPTQPGPAGAAESWTGVLTRKGNAPFPWWALQTDAGQVWQLELPAALPDQALASKQNCWVQAHGTAADGLLGARLLRLDHLVGLQRPELGGPENQRCQFSLPGP